MKKTNTPPKTTSSKTIPRTSSQDILSLEDYQRLRAEYEQSDSIRHRAEICKRIERELTKSLSVVNAVWEKWGRKDYFLFEGGVRSLEVITDSYPPLREQNVLCRVNGKFHHWIAVEWMFGDPKTYWTRHFCNVRGDELSNDVRWLEDKVEYAEETIDGLRKELRKLRKELAQAKERLKSYRKENEFESKGEVYAEA